MQLTLWVLASLVVANGAWAQTFVPACELMSQATAAEINGAPVSAGEELDNPGVGKQCTFDGNGNKSAISVREGLTAMMGMTPAEMFKMLETTPVQGRTVTVVSGLGDGAYFSQDETHHELWVLVGEVLLDVSVVQPQAARSGLQASMVAAAKTAVKKMQGVAR
jgi:hypothetical protein